MLLACVWVLSIFCTEYSWPLIVIESIGDRFSFFKFSLSRELSRSPDRLTTFFRSVWRVVRSSSRSSSSRSRSPKFFSMFPTSPLKRSRSRFRSPRSPDRAPSWSRAVRPSAFRSSRVSLREFMSPWIATRSVRRSWRSGRRPSTVSVRTMTWSVLSARASLLVRMWSTAGLRTSARSVRSARVRSAWVYTRPFPAEMVPRARLSWSRPSAVRARSPSMPSRLSRMTSRLSLMSRAAPSSSSLASLSSAIWSNWARVAGWQRKVKPGKEKSSDPIRRVKDRVSPGRTR